MKIDEISEKDSTVDILVKILSIDKRTVNTSRGETTYYYGLIGDDTGVIPYTAWEFPQVIKAGDAVEIKYARVKEYNGRLRIYIDSRTEVILKPGENIEVKNTYKEVKLQDISSKTPFVSVTGMVSGITEHEYQNQEANLFYTPVLLRMIHQRLEFHHLEDPLRMENILH